ncbi:universal stress protein [Roseovarius sp. A46]|uniref:universal stress protein n=1 Tax=Roseovarius sp. A46 TaxID=2109331 RepID=UPI0010119873|nr:universal stress protein [Roseovarius sp. A46]RXV66785.1 universal stress protein [Roseovarius sp. A46]
MYSHVLVPVSFDVERDSAGAFAVARLLADDNGHISLLHVIEQVPGYAAAYLPAGYQSEARKTIEARLAELAADLPNASTHVIEGHSGRTILDWAESHKPDCIVIASHRPGMQDLLLGSTAAKVVRHAACAVHVIR